MELTTFAKFGRLVMRTWPVWILAWGAAFVVLRVAAPEWREVASNSEMRHLPANTSTRIGQRLFDQAFPDELAQSNVIVVMSRDQRAIDVDDLIFVSDQLTPRLEQVARRRGGVLDPALLNRLQKVARELAPSSPSDSDGDLRAAAGEELADEELADDELADDRTEPARPPAKDDVVRIRTPRTAEISEEARVVSISAPHNSVEGPLLISEDGKAMVVFLRLTHPFLSSRNQSLIEDVERSIDRLKEQGRVPLGLDVDLSGSAVVGRDVYTAVADSIDAIKRWTVWIVFALLLVVFRAPLPALIPLVTLYCAVDISLNLMAMLAEGGYLELYDGLKVYATVLVYGAGVDYSLFLIARHTEELTKGKKVRTSAVESLAKVGAVVAISAATEVFAINMLSWTRFGKFVQAGQAIPLGLVVTLLASLTLTFALLRLIGRWGFWPLRIRKTGQSDVGTDVKRWPERGVTGPLWDGIGRALTRRPVTYWAVTVVLLLPLCVVAVRNSGNVTYDMTSELPVDSVSRVGNRVLREHFSPGVTGPITVLLRNERADFASREGIRLMERWERNLRRDNPDLHVADVRSVASPLGNSDRLVRHMESLRRMFPGTMRLTPIHEALVAADVKDPAQVELVERLVERIAASHYVSDTTGYDGHVTRISLVLDQDPLSRSSIDRIDRLRSAVADALPDPWRSDTVVFLLGPTASLFEIKSIADQDRVRLYFLVTGAVFLVLWILLADLVIAVYLVVTVLFTYLVTMGATFLIFSWTGGSDFVGLEWSAPVLLFTLLMAVGADYNVLLVQRYREHAGRDGKQAILKSLSATGGLISGAGIVMAGTFSALIWGGRLGGMHQLGVALVLGVLIDTFLVRPVLVPAFLIVRHDGWRVLRELLPRRFK